MSANPPIVASESQRKFLSRVQEAFAHLRETEEVEK